MKYYEKCNSSLTELREGIHIPKFKLDYTISQKIWKETNASFMT